MSFPGACTVTGFGILGSFRSRDSGGSALRPTLLDDCEEDESRTLAICFALANFESHKTPFEDYFQQVNHAYLRVRDLPGRGRELRAEIALHTARAAGFYPSFKSSQTRLDNSLVIHEFLGSLIYIRKGLLQYAGYKRRQSRRSTSLISNSAPALDLAA